ncbi:MAG: substrate-binding domain-containing protein [Acidobacteria bacterium]|nr:substrate-binding domain-containing protein [Acidobacteriota bacterium]
MLRRNLMLALALALAGCSVSTSDDAVRVRLATTTSTYNSGLLQDLLPPFEESTGIRVQVLAVGTGQALALGERGEVDLVLVHARRREDDFIQQGHGIERRDMMWNDFVILGPTGDPAGLRGGHDAPAALKRLKDAGARFVSRGDDSGTHIRELALWERAGGVPAREAFYLEAGQGMGNCLTLADEKEAYILSDRGTYLAFSSHLDLEVMVDGDPLLHNPYGVMLINPQRYPHVQAVAARKLLDYFTSAAAQRRIEAFRVAGETLFHPAAQMSP